MQEQQELALCFQAETSAWPGCSSRLLCSALCCCPWPQGMLRPGEVTCPQVLWSCPFCWRGKRPLPLLKELLLLIFLQDWDPLCCGSRKKTNTKLHFITGADFIVLDKEAADLSGLRMCSSAVLSVPADVLPLEDGQKQERMLQKAVQPSSRFLLQPTPTGLSSGELWWTTPLGLVEGQVKPTYCLTSALLSFLTCRKTAILHMQSKVSIRLGS